VGSLGVTTEELSEGLSAATTLVVDVVRSVVAGGLSVVDEMVIEDTGAVVEIVVLEILPEVVVGESMVVFVGVSKVREMSETVEEIK